MDERERQIRELIKGADDSQSPGRYGPMWPSSDGVAAGMLPPKDRTRITEARVAGDMRKEMLDGNLDPAAAREMRKKLAEQMYADMGLRGVTRFMGLKASAPRDIPEDDLYAKADRLAAQSLSMQRGVTQMDLERHANEPANYDPGRADFREAAAIGMPAGKDDYDARVQEIADQLFTQGRLEGHPISYEDARAVARDRHNRYLKEVAATPYGPVGDQDMRFSEPVVYSKPDGYQYQPPSGGPMSGDVIPAKQGPQPAANPYASPATVRPFTGAASPKQPAYDTTTRSSAGLDAVTAAEAAAAAALARRRAARRGNK